MVVDSGTTSHFMHMEENLPVKGPSNKIFSLPDGSTIKATHMTELPFPILSATARHAHVLPNLMTNSLISVSKLADAGYTTIFIRTAEVSRSMIPKTDFHSGSDASRSSKGGEIRMGSGG